MAIVGHLERMTFVSEIDVFIPILLSSIRENHEGQNWVFISRKKPLSLYLIEISPLHTALRCPEANIIRQHVLHQEIS